MIALTYRAQLQEQHQEGGAPDPATTGNPADGPVPDGFGDDDLIGDILGGGKDKAGKRPNAIDPEEVQEEEEPEDPTPPDDEPESAPEPEEEEEELEEAAESDAEPIEGSLEEARAARKAGDLDKACQIAFGCKPEELAPTAYDWTKWRAANDKAQRGLTKRSQEIDARDQQGQQWVHQQRLAINNIIEQLRPYEEVQLGLQAFDQHGDPEPLVKLIEKATKMSWADFNKAALTRTRRSPQERMLQQRMAELEQKLQQTQAEREQQASQRTAAEAYQADLAHIRSNVTGEVTKIPKFEQRIYQILVKTKGPLGLTKTIPEAAAMVVRAERKRIESHPFVRKPAPKGKVPPAASAAARTLAARSQNRPALRRDSQKNGAANPDKLSDDDIINDILSKRPARRSA